MALTLSFKVIFIGIQSVSVKVVVCALLNYSCAWWGAWTSRIFYTDIELDEKYNYTTVNEIFVVQLFANSHEHGSCHIMGFPTLTYQKRFIELSHHTQIYIYINRTDYDSE